MPRDTQYIPSPSISPNIEIPGIQATAIQTQPSDRLESVRRAFLGLEGVASDQLQFMARVNVVKANQAQAGLDAMAQAENDAAKLFKAQLESSEDYLRNPDAAIQAIDAQYGATQSVSAKATLLQARETFVRARISNLDAEQKAADLRLTSGIDLMVAQQMNDLSTDPQFPYYTNEEIRDTVSARAFQALTEQGVDNLNDYALHVADAIEKHMGKHATAHAAVLEKSLETVGKDRRAQTVAGLSLTSPTLADDLIAAQDAWYTNAPPIEGEAERAKGFRKALQDQFTDQIHRLAQAPNASTPSTFLNILGTIDAMGSVLDPDQIDFLKGKAEVGLNDSMAAQSARTLARITESDQPVDPSNMVKEYQRASGLYQEIVEQLPASNQAKYFDDVRSIRKAAETHNNEWETARKNEIEIGNIAARLSRGEYTTPEETNKLFEALPDYAVLLGEAPGNKYESMARLGSAFAKAETLPTKFRDLIFNLGSSTEPENMALALTGVIQMGPNGMSRLGLNTVDPVNEFEAQRQDATTTRLSLGLAMLRGTSPSSAAYAGKPAVLAVGEQLVKISPASIMRDAKSGFAGGRDKFNETYFPDKTSTIFGTEGHKIFSKVPFLSEPGIFGHDLSNETLSDLIPVDVQDGIYSLAAGYYRQGGISEAQAVEAASNAILVSQGAKFAPTGLTNDGDPKWSLVFDPFNHLSSSKETYPNTDNIRYFLGDEIPEDQRALVARDFGLASKPTTMWEAYKLSAAQTGAIPGLAPGLSEVEFYVDTSDYSQELARHQDSGFPVMMRVPGNRPTPMLYPDGRPVIVSAQDYLKKFKRSKQVYTPLEQDQEFSLETIVQ